MTEKEMMTLAALEQLRRQADQAFARVLEAHPREVACKKGCDDCCHAVFDLMPLEAWAIAGAFGGLERKQRRKALKRAEKAVKAFDAVVDAAMALPPQERARAVSRGRVACPLLEDGGCILYDHRPLTCRLYGVPVAHGGQPHICFKAGFTPGGSYPAANFDLLNRELERLGAELEKVFPGAWPRRRLDLGRALLLAAEKK